MHSQKPNLVSTVRKGYLVFFDPSHAHISVMVGNWAYLICALREIFPEVFFCQKREQTSSREEFREFAYAY